MGSEGPSVVTVHVTGFKKFQGVRENPTETIVSNLEGFLQRKGLPKGLVLGCCRVLETAGQGALVSLYQILESAVDGSDSDTSNSGNIIWGQDLWEVASGADVNPPIGGPENGEATRKWKIKAGKALFVIKATIQTELLDHIRNVKTLKELHLGVNSGAKSFAIEHQAVNEATFRCSDELGWKPQKVPIIPSEGGISQKRETSLPVDEIAKALKKMGYDVMPSNDAGRFVCNYVYYHSLRFAEQHGIKSLFVHVPLFSTIDEEKQMQFLSSLLEVLASL